MGDGLSWKPLGIVRNFTACISGVLYSFPVYVVEKAHFQLLLGMDFYHKSGAALFPLWKQVVLTIPRRVMISCDDKLFTPDTVVKTLKPEDYLPGSERPHIISYEKSRQSPKSHIMNVIRTGVDLIDIMDGPMRTEDMSLTEAHVTVEFVSQNV